MSVNTNDQIIYIQNNVDNLDLEERKQIYQMLINASVDDNKIQAKGRGIQISFSHIPVSMILTIYQFVKTKIEHKQKKLEELPD